ncbi:site-specific integrase [Plantactinospora soyae]|uniref:Uncharacterized protein n=1 Tax=Plantactinospora soyae TaxID=1544732 RepID=A0A927R766_9ACTN|nr:hypothetical protein [Plantactinospora soyae]MBE1489134.1 hypothetical protein [Plantactinospora soyae]
MTSDCADCGTIPKGRRGRRPVCMPCQLNRRLARLLHNGTEAPASHLAALADHLRADPDPEKLLHWLSRCGPAELLTALANGSLDLTHDALRAWPRPIPARHLQHHLVACGLLPPVDGHLLRFESWLHRRLDRLTDHPHERLLRRFALWHQLPRLRADATARPLRATATTYMVNQFNTAHAFLDWLHTRGIAPDAVSQTDLDTWAVTAGAGHRHTIRGFFIWATHTSAMPRHLVLTPVKFTIGAAITQQQRLALLRHYLTNQAPLRERAAACLMLLYGQPISRIHRLHNNDLELSGNAPTIRFGDPPTPIPEPIASLLRDLAAAAPAEGWLFPGRHPGQPITYQTLHRNLRMLSFPLNQARVSALRQLVAQVPAPVIADALGIHHTTAARQAVNAGMTWSHYASGNHSPLPPRSPRARNRA